MLEISIIERGTEISGDEKVLFLMIWDDEKFSFRGKGDDSSSFLIGGKYYKDRKYTIPERVTIGKLSEQDTKMMVPN